MKFSFSTIQLIKKIYLNLRTNQMIKQLIRLYNNTFKFRNEKKIILNKKINSTNKTSILHFSLNRAGTQKVKKILNDLAIKNSLIPIHLHDYAFHNNFPFLDQLSYAEMNNYRYLFREKGFIYTVFGGFIENIENINKFNIILCIRDPRDILVSKYYSYKYSHPPPYNQKKQENFLDKKKESLKISIDEFAINESYELYLKFSKYLNFLYHKSNVKVLYYEDMVLHFEKWQDDLLKGTDLSISDNLMKKFTNEHVKNMSSNENIYSHKRVLLPGDHINKLHKSTITYLNYKFNTILKTLNYEI